MPQLKDFRIRKGWRLVDVRPDSTPFARGAEDAQRRRLDELAVALDHHQDVLHAEGKRRVLLVLQGMDTAGKDGTVRWVFARTSPLGVRVTAFKVPTEEERARDFLWRCHAAVPRAGELMVWNRSHYEDVLVPVVNGWVDKAETKRRYRQINEFERLLCETGTVVVKCMLHISRDEQRERLQARVDDVSKQWKFSLGDLEVRKHWTAYQHAYAKALDATSTKHAPWHVVPADDKLHRNLMIAELLVRTLERMKLKPPKADPALKGLVVE